MAPLARWPDDVSRTLDEIVRELVILTPLSFRVAEEAPEMALSEATEYPNQALGDPLVRAIANRLYARWYCRRSAPSDREHRASDLLAMLQEANDTRAGWDAGWTLVSRDHSGTCVARKGARTRLVAADNLRIDDNAPADANLALRRRRDDLTLQPDYYYAYGEALGDRYEELVDARVYLNVAPDAAVTWTRVLTRELNLHGVPFTFKILRHAAAYERVDTCIVYVPRRHAGFVASLVLELARSTAGLRQRTPVFTRRVAAGIALADNPPGGGSFGLHRMQLVAEGIVTAARSDEIRAKARLDAIATRFRFARLDLRRPWLNPGNTEISIPPSAIRPAPQARRSTPWIEVAHRIGRRLVRDALWHRDQCTWLGWSVIPGSDGSKPAVCTAGGDLYAGTAGIALFLAYLARETDDARCRLAALGALRHTIARSKRGYWPVGAYSGLGGLLHAVTGVARALESIEVADTIPVLLERLRSTQARELEVDIIEGRAGAVRALLVAADAKDIARAEALRLARRFGQEAIDLARRQGEHWSWRTTLGDESRHLLGYAHGAAGIACALNQLFDKTGDIAFQTASNGALSYEWSAFDFQRKNWPDLRRLAARAAGQGESYMTAWCSGAAGTALGLARCLAKRADVVVRGYLDAAIETTVAKLTSASQDESFCLCHGIAGNAEILLQIHELTDRPRLRDIALAAAEEGLRRHHAAETWRCGLLDGGESPGLLLGLAGIGYFYLRLHDPSIPSPLAL